MLDRLTWGHFISVQLRRRPRRKAEVPYGNALEDPTGALGDCSNDLICGADSESRPNV